MPSFDRLDKENDRLKPDAILGISAFYHDSAAALVVNGRTIAAAQEERFTRKKHDAGFPSHAVRYVLTEAGVDIGDLSAIAFYDKPFVKFERLLETYHAFAPKGGISFLSSIPVWIKEKMFMRKMIWDGLESASESPLPKSKHRPPLLFPEHHLSHQASAFFPSPFESAAILTIDGVGEWATTTLAKGEGKTITTLRELAFPHSLGLLYSAFTYFLGFKVNSGEYKLMGLAPYGFHGSKRVETYKNLILTHLADVREDGSFLLNMEYFNFATGLTMCHDRKWEALFSIPRREPESELTQPHMDLALAIQEVTEAMVLKLAAFAKRLTGESRLVMAGGVALNCVANGKIIQSGLFDDIWVQPASGDAGGALGAALAAWHIWKKGERTLIPGKDAMDGAYLGPDHSTGAKKLTYKYGAVCRTYDSGDGLFKSVAERLERGEIVGWFQGRMEYGPRALGNRSILGDPRHPDMQKRMNLKIKFREGFRPFAPSVRIEDMADYFEMDRPSPYMLFVANVKQERCHQMDEAGNAARGILERLYFLRSDIPAVTHVDYSARIQSVSQETNPKYWELLRAFKERTGCGVLVNTSFNVRGEPIVCTAADAYRCFMKTEMDCLVIGDSFFDKKEQPPWTETAADEGIVLD
jgi:carbamoyltransferase